MVALLGVMIAVSSSIYIIESFIPFPLPVGRWGFSNSVVLFFASFDFKGSLIVAAGKSLIGSLFTGRFMTPGFVMGFVGAIGAAVVEWIMFRFKFGYFGASIAGSVVNNILQMLVGAYFIKSSYIFSLLPLFLAVGSVSAIGNVYLAKSYERFWKGIK